MTKSERARVYYLAARAKGLCGACKRRTPEPGRATCRPCLEVALTRVRTCQANNVAAGLCQCGMPRWGNRMQCERCVSNGLEYARMRLNRAKEEGLCIRCLKIGPAPDMAKCAECLARCRNRRK